MPLPRRSLVLVLALLAAGCNNAETPTVRSVTLLVAIAPKDTLVVGDSARAVTTVTGATRQEAGSLSFSSSRPEVAAIDATGRIVAIRAGETIITATLDAFGRTAQARVTVLGPALSVAPGIVTLGVLGTQRLTATFARVPAHADRGVVWSSSDTSIATVSEAGVVTGRRSGVTSVTGRSRLDPSASGTVQVTVMRSLPITLTVTPPDVILGPGNTQQLTATLNDQFGTSSDVTYASSDLCIATVSATGLVTAHNDGPARITVASRRDPTLTVEARVNVQSPQVAHTVIQSVTMQNAAGLHVPVDPLNVAGTIVVTLNVAPLPGPASLVELIVGGRLFGSRVPAAGAGGGSLAFVVNTAERDASGRPLYPNGQIQLQARTHRPPIGAACAGRLPAIEQVETRITLDNPGAR